MKKFLCYDTNDAASGKINVDNRGMLKPVDSELSDTSTNPVQNRVVKSALDALSEENAELKQDLTQIRQNAISTDTVKTVGTYEYKLEFINARLAEDGSIVAPNNIRAVTKNMYYAPVGCVIEKSSSIQAYVNWYTAEGIFIPYQSTRPENGMYFRVYAYKSDNSTITPDEAKASVIVTAKYSIPDIPIKTSQLLNDSGFLTEQDIPETYQIVYGKNLFTGLNTEQGAMLTAGNVNPTLTAYFTSDFIPVKSGKVYTVQAFDNYTVRITYTLYDKDKVPVGFENVSSTNAVSVTVANDGFLRFSSYTSSQCMVVEGAPSEKYEPYTPPYEVASDRLLASLKRTEYFNQNVLNGKKWTVCGDSFTAAGYSPMNTLPDGKYKGKNWTYPWLIGNRTGVEIYDFSACGRTLAYPAVPDGFTNSLTCPTANCYYQNIPEDTDIITIYLGINDSHHRSAASSGEGEDNTGVIPLGTITDNTTATYYGAWNVVLTWLLENRPFAHIGILVSNGCDTADYRVAQLEIAKKYGIPYIDLNGDERTPVMIRSQNPDISSSVKNIILKKQAVDWDGSKTGSVNTHPNDDAHEFESYFIEAWLRTL